MTHSYSVRKALLLAPLLGLTVMAGCGSSTATTGAFGRPAGGSCTNNSECASGICQNAKCQSGNAGGGPVGAVCSQSSDCQSGKCTAGVCEPASGPVTGPTGGTTTGQGGPAGMGPGGMCDPMKKNCGPGGTGTTGTGTGTAPQGGAACQPGVVGPVITDCGYPYQSNNALTNIEFSESEVLAAIVPTGGFPLASIQLFYNDEHAMTLGVREVVVNGASTQYGVSPLTSNPGILMSPLTGTNALTGDQAGVDPSGRPMWPALFVTDTTANANDVSGDWQWGGAAVNPTYVAGTWKGAVRTVTASGATITPDADPAKNKQNYGNGHTAPAGALTKPDAFGAEVRWDIRLEAGHNYRFQVMVHDGDQNKVGGDTGEACVTYCAGNGCPAGVATCSADANCPSGEVCSSGCCVTPPTTPPPGSLDGGTCPPNWQTYLATEGRAICTPPPTNGGCPQGYVITVSGGRQYCVPVQIR